MGPSKTSSKDFHVFPALPKELQNMIWTDVTHNSSSIITVDLEDEHGAGIFEVQVPKFPTVLHATGTSRGLGAKYYKIQKKSDGSVYYINLGADVHYFQIPSLHTSILADAVATLEIDGTLPATQTAGAAGNAALAHNLMFLQNQQVFIHSIIGTMPAGGQVLGGAQHVNSAAAQIPLAGHGAANAPVPNVAAAAHIQLFPNFHRGTPKIFRTIMHAAFDLVLSKKTFLKCFEDRRDVLGVSELGNWATLSVDRYLTSFITKKVMIRFPALKRLDLVIREDMGGVRSGVPLKTKFLTWRGMPVHEHFTHEWDYGLKDLRLIEETIKRWYEVQVGLEEMTQEEIPAIRLVLQYGESESI